MEQQLAAKEPGFWRGRIVLVTGATGLLGSWLIERLVGEGAEVVALIRDFVPTSHLYISGLKDRIVGVTGCLEDYALIERTLNEYEIDTVFHLGAQTIVNTANRSPLSTFESNIKGSWNLLEACRVSRLVKRVVVASSDKAYGSLPALPYTEDMPLKGEHPYDVSKSCADLLAQSFAKTYDLSLAITRCGNIYGGGDLNFNRIVPGTIRSLLANEAPIIRSDGSFTRDYYYVKDAAQACLLLAENLDRQEVRGQAFNFSNESPLSVLELVRIVIDLTGVDLQPEILNISQGEIRHQYLSSRKAHQILGWNAAYNIQAGLQETIEWYKNYLSAHNKWGA